MKLKLTSKFLVSLIIMAVVLTLSISFFSYHVSENYYQEMYTYRVVNGSKTIAKMLPLEDVKEIISENGDETEAYRRTFDLLNDLKKEGGITFLSLIVPQEDRVTFYIDTCVESMGDDKKNQLPYGYTATYEESARDEADLKRYLENWEEYSHGEVSEKAQIVDNKYGYNYTAVYPIFDEDGRPIAQIQYILDMQSVRNRLNMILYIMLAISSVIVLIASFCFFSYIKRSVTKPIVKLAGFTKEVTSHGGLNQSKIELNTHDEIEELGNSFNKMLEELDEYINNLADVTAEKERIGAELDIATRIQASMLPCIFPAFPEREEFEVYATMTPAKEVGGDFYDFFMVDEENLAIVIADVSGKGVPAALFMVIGKTLIKDHTTSGKDLGEVFTEVNQLLCESNSEELFITAFVGVLNLKTGKFRYVNAGHEIPFIARKNEKFKPYKIRAAFVLAGMEGIKYKSGEIQLEPGDKLFQYTDGVTEATDKNNQLFGMSRLEQTLGKLADKTPVEILQGIKEDIDEFVGEAPQFDDITMLCLEYRGEPEASKTVDLSLENIAELTDFVENTLQAQGASAAVIMKMNVALDELYSNIVKFSGAAYAKISCGVRDGSAYLRLEDDGIPYDPLKKEDADISLSAEEREIGGLGILIVKKSMDNVEYSFRDSKNILTITKKI